jgi:hypothetical protein
LVLIIQQTDCRLRGILEHRGLPVCYLKTIVSENKPDQQT